MRHTLTKHPESILWLQPISGKYRLECKTLSLRRRLYQHFPLVRVVRRRHYARTLHLLDHARGAVIAHAQAPLNHRYLCAQAEQGGVGVARLGVSATQEQAGKHPLAFAMREHAHMGPLGPRDGFV